MGSGKEVAADQYDLKFGMATPMRDGIVLSGTLYLPKSLAEPRPSVLIRTPYISDSHHERARYLAVRGLPTVIMDVRGRGNSQGEFDPYLQEANDGYDAVEWLAREPYCNGQIAMCGASYLGYCQWAAAKQFPPHLVTIVPTAAPCMGIDFPMRNNIFYPYLMHWLTLVHGRTPQKSIFGDSAWWAAHFKEWFQSGKSFRTLDTFLNNPSSHFQRWLQHPEPDEYWDLHNPAADQYARIDMPVLTITGSYDGDQPGALEHYRSHIRHASAAARARHFLVIGPWDHGGTTLPKAEFGGIKINVAGVLDIFKLHRDWFAWTLEGGSPPEFLKKSVAYYVMGAEVWRYADTLEAITASHRALYLDSNGFADNVLSSGSLIESAVAATSSPDRYTYDPAEVSGLEVDAEAGTPIGALTSQASSLALHGRQLVYHSPPFEADMEISGFFRLRAWISIDTPDTDLFVSIYEIDLSGQSVRLTTDGLRARYREGLRAPKLIRTAEPLHYEFDRFTFISKLVKKGHRLRLVIGPLGRLIETTFMQRNFNGGGVVSNESVEDSKPVTVTLFHDSTHPSALYVPIAHRAE